MCKIIQHDNLIRTSKKNALNDCLKKKDIHAQNYFTSSTIYVVVNIWIDMPKSSSEMI